MVDLSTLNVLSTYIRGRKLNSASANVLKLTDAKLVTALNLEPLFSYL